MGKTDGKAYKVKGNLSWDAMAYRMVDDRTYDLEFLHSCAKPKLFVSGSRDQYGPRTKLEALVSSLPEPKKLVIVDSADHFFEGRLREMREAIEAWIRDTIQ